MRIAGIALGALMMLFPTFVQAQDDLTPLIAWEFEGNVDDRDRYHPGQGVDIRYEAGHVGRAAVFNGRTSVANYGSQSRWTFSRRDDFTLDFWLKTSQTPETIATVIMARNPGENPNWSFVLAGRNPSRGRIPGHLSFELWTWDSQRINSQLPVNDGRWHHVQAYFDRESSRAVLLVDDEISGAMKVEMHYTGTPARLCFGNNIGDHQPYEGMLDTIKLYRGVPRSVARFARMLDETQKLGRDTVQANDDAWLARVTAPQPIHAADLSQWRARRQELRRQVLACLGLSPFPYTKDQPGDLLPLDVRWGGKRDYPDFSVQALAWQTWQGVYAHGYLYLPKGGSAPYPAILHPHGHFALGTAAPEVQRRCIALAKQGYIGLSVKSTHPESLPWGISPLTGMTWNNLRALDYLCSRPDVNQARLGCTGASGGGQQTHFLMCIDDRLDAAVPAVYSSYMKEIMTGRTWVHCNCNWIPGLLAVTDEPEMAAAFAPRPLLFISNQQDWTARWETEGLPDVRKVYGWHGAEGAVENAQYSEPHGYPKPWRERMYAFFNQHFMGGGLASVVEPDSLPELSPREMAAMLPEVPTCQERVDRLEAEFAARLGKRLAEPRDRADAARLQHNLLEHLRRFLHEPAPTRRASPPATVHEDVSGDCRLRVVHVSTEPEITVPALLITALGGASARSLVILVDGRGKEVVFAEEEKLWRGLLAAGAGILIPDVRYWGELSTHPAWPRAYGTLVGRPPAAVAAHDVLELARSLRTTGEFDRRRIVVMGIGDGAVPALLAGALDEELEGVAGTDVGPTYTEGRTTPVCTGILQVCDLPDLACLLAPRPLFWAGVPDTAAYASADRFAKVVRARGHLITSERENAERPGLLAWYSTLRERR